MYYDGNGAEQDYAMAMRMYQRGLEFGYNQGNAELGRMYEDGDGCEKDLRKAFSYYSKSNANGEKLGMYLLGRCYMYAIGTEADGEQAVALFTALYKDSGFKSEYEWAYRWTCYFLGLCYEIGFGAQRDLDQAVSYYIMSENPDALFHASRLVKLYSLWKKGGRVCSSRRYGRGTEMARCYTSMSSWHWRNGRGRLMRRPSVIWSRLPRPIRPH